MKATAQSRRRTANPTQLLQLWPCASSSYIGLHNTDVNFLWLAAHIASWGGTRCADTAKAGYDGGSSHGSPRSPG